MFWGVLYHVKYSAFLSPKIKFAHFAYVIFIYGQEIEVSIQICWPPRYKIDLSEY